ncbi:MAG: hypothetical protein ACXV8X_13775 [Candidatus Angelobacter sp.]
MWKDFFGISLHDPIIWFALIAATIILFAWRTEVKRTRLLEQFAIARGFKFERVLEAEALGLSETDFFYRRDDIRNAVSGNLNGARFTLFDQLAQRGKNSFNRTIVAFEIDPSASFRPTMLGGYGFQMEKTASRIFVWQEDRRVPLDELEPFLHSALLNFQQAIR